MTRKKLAERLGEVYSSIPTKKDAEAIVKCVFTMIGTELVKGNEVAIKDFGVFKVVDRAERKGRNPQTGEEMLIPAHKSITFSAFKPLKEALNS